MNKLLLLGAASILTTSATAQIASKAAVNPGLPKHFKTNNKAVGSLHVNSGVVAPVLGVTSNKGAATPPSRWYNFAEAMGTYNFVTDMYDDTHLNFVIMWQDSSVRYIDASSPSRISESGIAYQSIGQVFDPKSVTFTDANVPNNQGLQEIGPSDAYTIDSVEVLGIYQRQTGSTSVDTLIFTMISESVADDFATFNYGTTSSVFQNHNIDSFKAQLWRTADYQTNPINQVAYYQSFSAPVQYKLPLTATTDSLPNGLYLLGAPMNVAVPAGRKASVSITFKSGSSYTAGDTVTKYNYFAFASHEINPNDYVVYPDGEMNMSSVVTNDTTFTSVTSTLNSYTPTIAYTTPFSAELHNIGFKVTCNTCSPVSVKDVNITSATAHPNPANTELFVPVTLKTASEVAVTLTNPMGQVVATQKLGKVAAGQTATATFNTAALASGVYFYTVEAAGTRTTNRVVVSH